MARRLRSIAGFTLVEMLLVVLVMSVIAGMLLLDPAISTDSRLDLGAERVAQALRFARTEAVRTQSYFRVTGSTSGRITVHALNASQTPPQTQQLARHPVTRQPIDFNLIDEALTQGVVPTGVSFDFEVIGSRSVVDFGPSGMPKYVDSGGTHRALTAGTVTLEFGGRQRLVLLDAQTGRVTIQ